MTRTLLSAALVIASISAAPAFADKWKTIRTEADFRSQVVDKKVTWNGNWGIINADGTAEGKLQKQGAYEGNWVWSGRFYCRNFVIGGKATGTNCAKVEISGDKVRFLNDKGKGRVTEAVFD